jgi:pimeloyl-ACP methyl ester carboxylesterase
MAVVTSPHYREKVVTFGDESGLVGVITIPSNPRADAPVAILLNSGIIHRVGANRIHVLLARMLADLGVTTLRFDLSGIGDSARGNGAGALQDAVNRDVAAAFRLLTEQYGASRFLLAGLCSGAYDAFHAALAEPRVSGVVLLDIPGPFQNFYYVLHRLKTSMMRSSTWRRPGARLMRLMGSIDQLARRRSTQQGGSFVMGVRPTSTREIMERQMDSLLSRGVKMFFAFTPGVPDNYNHRALFRRSFPKAAANPNVSFAYLPNSDHTFTREKSRSQIMTLIRDWAAKCALTCVMVAATLPSAI